MSLSTIEQGLLPADVQVTKLFLASDVQEIKQELIAVKSLGSGTVEEWLKGLAPRGQARLNEYRKWEKWANAGSLQQVRRVTDPYSLNSATPSQPTTATAVSNQGKLHNTTYKYQSRRIKANVRRWLVDNHQAPAPIRRTLEEVAALKAARTAEIERRASLLDPPLLHNVLRHMVSFQAATQLITTLDDNAWDLLRPRLLAEKSEAEEIENRVSAQLRMLQGQDDKNSHLEATLATTKEAKDAVDRNWEEVQAPLRAQIVRYIDEFIRDSWDKGKKVKQDNCSRFAAEALIHVRKRFYAQVAKEADAAKTAGREPATDPPDGPFLRKLTLDNMRWIFDTKIKPLTAPFRKEIFFCNTCTAKPFGFEGVVQHYAAKHTDKLSSGNIVVHWRAEWPEEPPFNPEGRMKVVYPVPRPAPYAPGTVPPPAYPFNSYAPPPGSGVPPAGQPFAPGPSYGGPPYAEQYGYQHPGHAPNHIYPPPTTPGLPSQSYAPPQPGWNPYQTASTPPQAVGYQPPMSAPGPVPAAAAVPGPYNYGPAGYPGAGNGGYPPSQAPYTVQLDDIVRNSREIWNTTANMRDLPGSVRVFVTISHVAKRFVARFSQTPTLAIFQDGLSNHKDMRPVRNINGLACKACKLGLGNAPYIQKDRDSFSLPQLVNHFQSKHVEEMLKEAPNAPPLDWTNDMILLPPPAVLAKLPSSVGSDAAKYRLLSEVFPEVFGLASAAPAVPFYGQHPSQPAPYTHHSQYGSSAPPPTVGSQEQLYHHQQDPHQTQGQQATDGHHSYQPRPDYAQGHQQTSYFPPPPQDLAYQPDQVPPNPAVASVAEYDTPQREENSSRSSQGSRQRPQQNAKWNRKERKRHPQKGHGGQTQRGPKEEEPKLPEEEKAREEEMRAMWANDRAVTARVFRNSEQSSASKPTHGQSELPAKESRGESQQEPRGPTSRKDDQPSQEGPSLLDALEMHLDQGRKLAAQTQAPPRDRIAAGYVNSSQQRATVAPEAVRRPAERYPTLSNRRAVSPVGSYIDRAIEENPRPPAPASGQHGDQFHQGPVPSRPAPDEVMYEPRDQLPPAHYHEAPPARGPDAHQSYDRGYRQDEQGVYERAAPQERLRQDYRHRSAYPEELIPPPPRGPPTGQLYEIVEVIDTQGSYFIRRPIGRVPPQEQVYYDYPYEPAPPRERQMPIGTGRGGPELYPPRPAGQDGYPRPPLQPAGDDGYARPSAHQAPLAQPQRDQYPLPLTSARTWTSDYPPHRNQRQPTARPEAPTRGGYEEEEYDPRYPAGSPPGQAEYQRRQVRYE